MPLPLNSIEMFDELVSRGYVIPANVEPASWMEPTAYVTVPTSTAFVTPPVGGMDAKVTRNAKLGSRSKRDTKGNKRSKRRISRG